jgi:hypothetical protein
MGLALLAECDGCYKTAKLVNKTMNEAPDGWIAFTIGPETHHACSLACAEKAAVAAVTKLFEKKS